MTRPAPSGCLSVTGSGTLPAWTTSEGRSSLISPIFTATDRSRLAGITCPAHDAPLPDVVPGPAQRVWLPVFVGAYFDKDVKRYEPENQMILAPLWMESVAPAGCRVRRPRKAVNHGD